MVYDVENLVMEALSFGVMVRGHPIECGKNGI